MQRGRVAGPSDGGRKGVSGRVGTGSELRQGLSYGNNRSLRKYEGEVIMKTMSDMAVGQAMVFKAEVVEEKGERNA